MTPRIEIDDEVFKYLQSKAIAFVETPNDTLRRLLGVNSAPTAATNSLAIATAKAHRKPKANLGRLVQAQLLANGQKLFLHDHQGRRVPNATAYIGGDGIFANQDRKRLCSMSDLAQELLKKQGYESDSVRGPSHWYTEDGQSVTDLWEKYLHDSASDDR